MKFIFSSIGFSFRTCKCVNSAQICSSEIHRNNFKILSGLIDLEKCKGTICSEHGLYISAVVHVIKLLLNNYVLLVFMNTILLRLSNPVQNRGSLYSCGWAPYLNFDTC